MIQVLQFTCAAGQVRHLTNTSTSVGRRVRPLSCSRLTAGQLNQRLLDDHDYSFHYQLHQASSSNRHRPNKTTLANKLSLLSLDENQIYDKKFYRRFIKQSKMLKVETSKTARRNNTQWNNNDDADIGEKTRLPNHVAHRHHGTKQHPPSNLSPPWQCNFEPRWIRLGDGYFPPYVLSGKCEAQKSCLYGLFHCQPKKYVLSILRKVRNSCVPVPTTGSAESHFEEQWVPSKHRVTVGCECAPKRQQHFKLNADNV